MRNFYIVVVFDRMEREREREKARRGGIEEFLGKGSEWKNYFLGGERFKKLAGSRVVVWWW